MSEDRPEYINPVFLVSVDGTHAPQHEHNSEAAARAEAERLASKSQSRHSRIRVLMQVDVLEPKHSHAWRSET